MPYMVNLDPQSPYVPTPVQISDYTPGTLSKPITVNGERIVSMINSGVPLNPNLVPQRFSVGVSAEKLPEVFSLKLGFGVSDRFRNKVEELEPDVHQFFPVNLTAKGVELVKPKYWLLHVCNRVDAIDVSKSEKPDIGDMYGSQIKRYKERANLVLSKECIDGKCIWIDRRIGHAYFFSDQLVEFIDSNNIAKFEKWRVEME